MWVQIPPPLPFLKRQNFLVLAFFFVYISMHFGYNHATTTNHMHLIIAASRSFGKYSSIVHDFLSLIEINSETVVSLGSDVGCDAHIASFFYGKVSGILYHKPDWSADGKAAAYKRVPKMLAQCFSESAMTIVFWDGISKCTACFIEQARAKKLPFILVNSKNKTITFPVV